MLEYTFRGVYVFQVGRLNACKAVLRRSGRQRFTRQAFEHWWQAQEYGIKVSERYFTMWGQGIPDLENALDESLKLQKLYAMLLNGYDGGERIIFHSRRQWIARLEKIGTFRRKK